MFWGLRKNNPEQNPEYAKNENKKTDVVIRKSYRLIRHKHLLGLSNFPLDRNYRIWGK